MRGLGQVENRKSRVRETVLNLLVIRPDASGPGVNTRSVWSPMMKRLLHVDKLVTLKRMALTSDKAYDAAHVEPALLDQAGLTARR